MFVASRRNQSPCRGRTWTWRRCATLIKYGPNSAVVISRRWGFTSRSSDQAAPLRQAEENGRRNYPCRCFTILPKPASANSGLRGLDRRRFRCRAWRPGGGGLQRVRAAVAGCASLRTLATAGRFGRATPGGRTAGSQARGARPRRRTSGRQEGKRLPLLGPLNPLDSRPFALRAADCTTSTMRVFGLDAGCETRLSPMRSASASRPD